MKVVLSSHRVENLPFIEKEFEKAEIIVLEEPPNDLFRDVLEGKISAKDYVESINTQFPRYTLELLSILRKFSDREIYQIEPYLEEVEKLKHTNVGNEKVREMERRVNMAYIDYAESFIKSNFDEIVQKVVEFAKADAERFVMRDEMRAKAIDFDGEVVVEAGLMHTKLVEFLDAEVVTVPELIAEELGTEYLDPPGNVLTKTFIYGEDADTHLLAARSLVFVTLVEKGEMVPDSVDIYPHFIHEQKLVRFVNKLDYEKCKRVFTNLWKHK